MHHPRNSLLVQFKLFQNIPTSEISICTRLKHIVQYEVFQNIPALFTSVWVYLSSFQCWNIPKIQFEPFCNIPPSYIPIPHLFQACNIPIVQYKLFQNIPISVEHTVPLAHFQNYFTPFHPFFSTPIVQYSSNAHSQSYITI